MDSSQTPSPHSPPVSYFLPLAILLMALGWGGLALLIIYTVPSGGTRWAFFFAGVLAITGTALPFVAFLNRRFPTNPPATHGVILRQALWPGIYLPTLAWLRIGRVLTPSMAILLAIGLLVVEFLLRLRERAEWKPDFHIRRKPSP
jgi:hypothetical protein